MLATFAGDRLRSALAASRPGCDVQRRLLLPHGECVLHVDAKLKARASPRMLENILTIGDSELRLETGVAVGSVPVIGSPVEGGAWVAVHSPDWPRGHRRVFYPAEGGDVLPGRFAIDFVKTSSSGATSRSASCIARTMLRNRS